MRAAMDRITKYRVIVVGSGPAGCTAAIYLSRANLAPLVLEGLQPGGQLTITTDVENYPGFPEGILGPKLMDLMRQQAERFGAVFKMEQLESVNLRTHPFELTTDQHIYECDALIVAAGASAMQLGLPSEKALQGFYGSEEWAKRFNDTVTGMIEGYNTIVLETSDPAIAAITRIAR